MVFYRNSTDGFLRDVRNGSIAGKVEKTYKEKTGQPVKWEERISWENSLRRMGDIVAESRVPDNCGVLIEYNLPDTNRRIDFVMTGHDEESESNFLIVELKQWQSAEATDREGVVRTIFKSGIRETIHPAYQANRYEQYLRGMNTAVYEGRVHTSSCAYLHNYARRDSEPLLKEQYQEIIGETPVFFKSDEPELEKFIRKKVGKGNGLQVIDEVENARILPSRKLVDYVAELFNHESVYTLLDTQLQAYSTIIDMAVKAYKEDRKEVLIIEGGPGTGKSVVAMKALIRLLEMEMPGGEHLNVRYVAPNSAFRRSIIETLRSNGMKSRNGLSLEGLFTGSGKYFGAKNNEYDVLICDEAHRLRKAGAWGYRGVSQVEDIVKAARLSVFFIDEHQTIRPEDEGSADRIQEVYENLGYSRNQGGIIRLKAQFRCSGAAGYLQWLKDTLQIAETGNFDGWDREDFQFRIFDDPNDMYDEIRRLNESGEKARMVAGYDWNWTDEEEGNDDAQVNDVRIDQCGFAMPWNSHKDRDTWAVNDRCSNQIGSVHTVQGMEFDYIGVIIGPDLRFDPRTGRLYADAEEYRDSKGKKGLTDHTPEHEKELTTYIKNIYWVLMSRGMKGCFVYCVDSGLQEYLRERDRKSRGEKTEEEAEP